ncbi:MAG: extensin family protein, partial [Burkholderiales bacterium]
RHATADALDVAGFVLSNGRDIRIERDWGSDDPDGLFLRQVRDGACRVFDGVLGPDYNAAHRNHFHLESGGYRMCR